MVERMGREDRKDQLSHIMMVRYAGAGSQADFTATSLACEAGISVVWFYALVGKEFRKLRAQLPGHIVADDTLIGKLRSEIADLHAQLMGVKERYESTIKERLAAAIHHIERLDEENRMLRDTVRILERRLSDEKLVISASESDGPAVLDKRQT